MWVGLCFVGIFFVLVWFCGVFRGGGVFCLFFCFFVLWFFLVSWGGVGGIIFLPGSHVPLEIQCLIFSYINYSSVLDPFRQKTYILKL